MTDKRKLVAERNRLQVQLDGTPAPDAPHYSAAYRKWVSLTRPLKKRIEEIDALVPKPKCWAPRPATESDARIARKFKSTKTAALLFAAGLEPASK